MGSLKSLTIQPRTRARYDKAKAKFYDYLRFNSLELPTQKSLLDGLLCDYLEYLWATGEGRALASDTLAALQDTSPRIKGSIPGAWRLLRTWLTNEIPNRAPPMPERVVHALTGYFLFHGQPRMALSVLLGFYSMLRTGELLGIRNKDVTVDVRNTTAVISLGFTKGGKRTGASESTTIAVTEVVRRLAQWDRCTSPGSLLCPTPATWRKSFSQALSALSLETWEFRPYSLRRGGATFWFGKHGSLDRILLQGRWMAARTARTYLNEGLAVLAEMKIPAGCAGALLACMTASSDVELMRWAAKALESLCAGDQGVFSEPAGEAGALESLVSALRHHNDPESLRCLAATLSSLLQDDMGLLRAGVLETLVSALRINRNDPESLRCLAGALGSLVNKDFGTVRLSAVKADAIESLASVLLKNSKHEGLQETASYALWKICEGDDAIVYRQRVMEADVPEVLRDAVPFHTGENQQKLQEFIDLIDPEIPRCWGESLPSAWGADKVAFLSFLPARCGRVVDFSKKDQL
eukprot:s2458_g7.t1